MAGFPVSLHFGVIVRFYKFKCMLVNVYNVGNNLILNHEIIFFKLQSLRNERKFKLLPF